jgi:hypothetical protein
MSPAASKATKLAKVSNMADDFVSRREFEAVVNGLRDFISQGFTHSESTAILRDKSANEAAVLRENANREAIKVALDAINKRFDNTNEWRDVVDDDRKDLARKESVERLEELLVEIRLNNVSKDSFKELKLSVDSMLLSEAELKGKATQGSVIIGYVMAAIGWILGTAGIFIKFIK